MQNSTPAAANAAEETIDVHAILAIVMEGRWWIAGSFLLCVLLSFGYLFTSTPIYQSDALVQVETKNSGASAALGEMAEAFGKQSPISGELEIIKSRMVIGQVVDRLNLTIRAQPDYFPVVGQAIANRFRPTPEKPFAKPLFGMKPYAWGGESIVVSRADIPEAWVGISLLVVLKSANAYDVLDQNEKILLSGIVGEQSTAETPYGPATFFIQTLKGQPGTRFHVTKLPRENAITGLRSRLTASEKGSQSGIVQITYRGANRRQVADILNALVTIYQRQNVERKSAEAQSTLAFLEQQLPELRKKLDISESALNAFRLKVGSIDLTQETQIVLQETVQLEQARLDLEQKKREALQRFTPSHPVIQTLDAQIQRISGRLSGINTRTKALPETQQELLTLMQNVKVNTDLYANLLNNAQELQIIKAGTVGNVRIIDYALIGRSPIEPQQALVLGTGVFLGLALGILLVFIRSVLHDGVKDPAIVERATGLATYASVPFATSQQKLMSEVEGNKSEHAVLAIRDPQDVAIESLRSLRSALHFAMADAPNNVIMLTGPSPGLGKSFISMNLGATLAASNKKVVVIDADMRRGQLHAMIAKPRNPGLSDVLVGTCKLDQALVRMPADNLYLLPTGTIPPNPSEMLLKVEFADLIKQLSGLFDLVIIDTPPVLAVADASIVGRLAGTTLLVLKTAEHPLRMIEDSVGRLRAAGIAVRGTIFNQTQRSQGYYGNRYGYQYGYYHYEYKQRSK